MMRLISVIRALIALVASKTCSCWSLAAKSYSNPFLKDSRQSAVRTANEDDLTAYVSYEDQLCAPEVEEEDLEACELPEEDEFLVAILGDLHIDPRYMEDYGTGRDHFKTIINDATQRGVSAVLVSLGDLGESKSVRPSETTELFAGTSECHQIAADYLSSFDVPYEVVGGNHDLEGIEEFSTDEENLAAYLAIHKKPTAQFKRLIAEKTLLVGLGSTVFRDSKYTSHEVTIDDAQIEWFEEVVASHPSSEGWKIIVFTHAPIIGSGIRVIQANHVVNGCCWLNHSGGNSARFIELVRKHRCIKAWFSGHFHLGQDYEDSITFPTVPREVGPYPNRGSCVFAQTSVMRSGSSRDGRQQSRLLRGNKDGFEVCTVDHADGGSVRVDATISYTDLNHEVGVYTHKHEELQASDSFVKVYSPTVGDGKCATPHEVTQVIDATPDGGVDHTTVSWWHMNCGRVLGIYDSRMVEYEPSTLAPLGLVVGADELAGRRVLISPSSRDGAFKVEQAILLVDDEHGTVTVVQPNEDGSFWRKIVRNKMVRMREQRREQAAAELAEALFCSEHGCGDLDEHFVEEASERVVSTWGPYTQISGTAKRTAVPGMYKEVFSFLQGSR